MKYKIIGPVAVLGTAPGQTVTEAALQKAGANITALLGYHLEPLDEPKDDAPEGEPTEGETPEGEPTGRPARKRSSG